MRVYLGEGYAITMGRVLDVFKVAGEGGFKHSPHSQGEGGRWY